jgi:hypothetical protein
MGKESMGKESSHSTAFDFHSTAFDFHSIAFDFSQYIFYDYIPITTSACVQEI